MKFFMWLILGYVCFFIFCLSLNFYVSFNRSISVLAWGGTFCPEVIAKFEKKTGIKVNISYFSSNEELISKIILTDGRGIDIIVPSDYALHCLKEKKLLTPLKTKRIAAYKSLYKFLLLPKDQGERYKEIFAVPIEWGVYGIAFKDTLNTILCTSEIAFKAFFEGVLGQRKFALCMTSDIIPTCNLAWMYYRSLFSNDVADQRAMLTIVYEILKKQHKSIVCYNDTNIKQLFVNNSIDIAFLQSDEFIRSHKEISNLQFILPYFGILKTVEYIALSKNVQHLNESYEFINFILDNEQIITHVNTLGYLPVRYDINKNDLLPSVINLRDAVMNNIKQLQSVSLLFDEKERLEILMRIKN